MYSWVAADFDLSKHRNRTNNTINKVPETCYDTNLVFCKFNMLKPLNVENSLLVCVWFHNNFICKTYFVPVFVLQHV